MIATCLLATASLAQPATVPGVRIEEPPQRPAPADSLPPAPGQPAPTYRYLAVDVTGRFGGFHRYRIYPSETMAFRTRSEGDKYRYKLTSVSDTAFTIAFQNELYDQPQPLSFPLADVKRVYLTKNIPFVSQAAYILPVAAVVFVVADYVNPRSPDGYTGRYTFDRRSLIPGGLLLLGGGICYKLTHRSYVVNNRHRLRILWTN